MKYNYKEEKIKLENIFKTVASIQKSKENINSVIKYSKEIDPTALGAIFHSCIINYARPFTNNKTENGNTYKFSLKSINKSKSLDTDLHNFILLLRKKVIAHSDIELVDSKVIYQTMQQSKVEQIPLRANERQVLIGVCGNSELLLLPRSTKLLIRMKSHIEMLFERSMEFLSDELLKHFQAIENDESALAEIINSPTARLQETSTLDKAMEDLVTHEFTNINKDEDQWGDFWFMNLKHTMSKKSNEYKLSSDVFFEKGGINKKFKR
ncbi:hypothetical protein ABMA67_02515 [Halobacteriovorax sp. RZ-3]|uniref:hypothetical protein n=1 Tax=Halobacteriovorax sp. RZ-3 TaxID=3157720 RepID=UPI003719D1BE